MQQNTPSASIKFVQIFCSIKFRTLLCFVLGRVISKRFRSTNRRDENFPADRSFHESFVNSAPFFLSSHWFFYSFFRGRSLEISSKILSHRLENRHGFFLKRRQNHLFFFLFVLLKKTVLAPNTDGFEIWLNPPVKTLRSYRLFDVINSIEVMTKQNTPELEIRETLPLTYE